jgi:hypothetical protein
VWLAGGYLCRHGRGNAGERAPRKGRLQQAINHLDTVVDRSELTGIAGVRIWFGHGVFAHNLVKLSTLAA